MAFEEIQFSVSLLIGGAPKWTIKGKYPRKCFLILLTARAQGHKTVNVNLEIKMFQQAGRILTEMRSKLIIDGHPVIAEFLDEEPPTITVIKYQKLNANHVRELQFLLQLLKMSFTIQVTITIDCFLPVLVITLVYILEKR